MSQSDANTPLAWSTCASAMSQESDITPAQRRGREWHKADVEQMRTNVRFRGKSGLRYTLRRLNGAGLRDRGGAQTLQSSGRLLGQAGAKAVDAGCGVVCFNDRSRHFADFGNATIMSSSIRAPGDDSWLMHTVVEAGSQSPK